MAKVSVTFDVTDVHVPAIIFNVQVFQPTASGPALIVQDTVTVDVPVSSPLPTSISHQAPVIS